MDTKAINTLNNNISENIARYTRALEMLEAVKVTDSASKEKLARARNLIAASIHSLDFAAKSPNPRFINTMLESIKENISRFARALIMLGEVSVADISSNDKLTRAKNLTAISIQSLEDITRPFKSKPVKHMTESTTTNNQKFSTSGAKLGK